MKLVHWRKLCRRWRTRRAGSAVSACARRLAAAAWQPAAPQSRHSRTVACSQCAPASACSSACQRPRQPRSQHAKARTLLSTGMARNSARLLNGAASVVGGASVAGGFSGARGWRRAAGPGSAGEPRGGRVAAARAGGDAGGPRRLMRRAPSSNAACPSRRGRLQQRKARRSVSSASSGLV